MGYRRWLTTCLAVALISGCSSIQTTHREADMNTEDISSPPPALPGTPVLMDAVSAADGSYDDAIDILMPAARTGEAEALQAIAQIILLWNFDSSGQGTPKYTMNDAWNFYRQAVLNEKGRHWIAAGLAYYYEQGRPGLPRNSDVAECLRRLARGGEPADDSAASKCFELE